MRGRPSTARLQVLQGSCRRSGTRPGLAALQQAEEIMKAHSSSSRSRPWLDLGLTMRIGVQSWLASCMSVRARQGPDLQQAAARGYVADHGKAQQLVRGHLGKPCKAFSAFARLDTGPQG